MTSSVTSSSDVTCPIITLSSDSELADVGESFFTAELPPQPSDWLSTILSSLTLANHSTDLLTAYNQNADLLTLASHSTGLPTLANESADLPTPTNESADLLSWKLLDVNDNYVRMDSSLTCSDLDELDGTVTCDEDLSDDLLRRGTGIGRFVPNIVSF